MTLGGIRNPNPSNRAGTGIGPKGCNLVNSVFALSCFRNWQNETDKLIITLSSSSVTKLKHTNLHRHTNLCHVVVPFFIKIALLFPVNWHLEENYVHPLVSPSTPSRHIEGVEVQLHWFLTSALDRGERLTSRPGHFTPRKEPRYPLNTKVCGPQSRFGNYKKKKKNSCP